MVSLKKTVASTKTRKQLACSLDGVTDFSDIVSIVLQEDNLTSYMFIICLDYVLRTSIDLIKENGSTLKKKDKN